MESRLTICALAAITAATVTDGASAQVFEEWVVQYDGPGHGSDYIRDVHVRDDGAFYMVGVTDEGSADYADMLVAAYGSDGAPIWIRHWNGPADGYDHADAIGVDSLGNIYVGGYAYNGDLGTSYALVKYDSSGTEQWSRRYWGPSHESNIGSDLVIDQDGNIYFTGYISLDGGVPGDVTTLKYDPSGDLLWDRQYGDPYGGWDQGGHIALDAAGDIIVSGRTEVAASNSNILVLKYDADGALIWSRDFGGPADRSDAVDAMVIGADDSIYLAGYGRRTGNEDALVVKYDAAGDLQWTSWYDGPDALEDRMHGIASLDDLGDVYVTGHSEWSDTGQRYITAKIDASGVGQWLRIHKETDEHYATNEARSIFLDEARHVYVTGTADRFIPPDDEQGGVGTVSYDSDGNERWSMFLDGDAGSGAGGTFVHAGDDREVLVVGWKWTQENRGDCLVVKYLEGDCNGNGLPDVDEIIADPALDADGSGILDECEDRGDLDGDGTVGFADLLIVVAAWGACPDPPAACPADIDDSGSVGFGDLLVVLANWG